MCDCNSAAEDTEINKNWVNSLLDRRNLLVYFPSLILQHQYFDLLDGNLIEKICSIESLRIPYLLIFLLAANPSGIDLDSTG